MTACPLPQADPVPLRLRPDRRIRNIPLPNGSARREHCDFIGRVHAVEDPDGGRLFSKYDSAGRLTEVHDGKAPLITYGHPTKGEAAKLTARTSRSETIVNVDASGRPVELVIQIDNLEWTVGFDWSTEGTLLGLRYPGTTEWLRFGRTGASLEWTCGQRVHLTGDAERSTGRSRIRYSNRAVALEEMVVARNPHLSRIAHFDIDDEAIVDYSYAYDGNDRIVRAGAEEFDYDDHGRLSRALIDEERRYHYDAENRLVETQPGHATFTYEQGPMIAGAVSGERHERFAYDAVGRRIRKETSEGPTVYEYDGLGQLSSVLLPNGDFIEYVYDGFGRLIARQSKSNCVYYLTDLQGRRLAEADESGRILRSYLWLGGQCCAVIEGAIDQPITRTFHRVHGGRLAAIGEADGHLRKIAANDPFGGDSPIDDGVPAFASLFGDSETRLLYAGSRWLDPAIAQFLTPDTWFGRDAAAMFPPSVRRFARATPGGPQRTLTAAAAYNWCDHEPINRSDPNGHSWYGLILTSLSALVWSLQLTTVSLELEIFNIVAEILQWFPLFRPAWPPHSGPITGWDKFWRTSIFNLSAPVASSRLNVPLAFVLNGFFTNVGGSVWTMGNIIWASGSELRNLENSSKRTLLICANAPSYVASVEEVAATMLRARSPFARGTATVDAAGTLLTGVAITAPPAAASADVFMFADWISVRTTADASTETPAQVVGVGAATLDLADPLPASLRGQAVEIARLDSAIVKIEKGDSLIARSVTFIRGTSIHFAKQIPEGFPQDTLTVTEYMPAGIRNLITATSNNEFYVVRFAVDTDRTPYAANDFVRVRSGTTYFARKVGRTHGTRSLILDDPLPRPTPPASYATVEVVKMNAAGAAVPNQTANRDRVNVGNVVGLRKFDGLAIENTGGAPATTERRIVLSLLMDCQVVALDAALQNVAVKVEKMITDASKQASGTNTSATVITTTAGQAGRFSTGNWVRVRTGANTDAATMVVAVNNTANTITLRDGLDGTAFPNGTAVTVTLIEVGRELEAENVIAPGDHIKVKSDNPGDLLQGDIIRVVLSSNSGTAAARVISAAPVVVAVVNAVLQATHTAGLTVQRLTPLAATLHANAVAPDVQLRFTARGAAPVFAADTLVTIAADRTRPSRNPEQAWGKVLLPIVGQDVFLTDPIEYLLPTDVEIVTIAPTGLNTNGAHLDESKVLVPSAVLSTKPDDPDLEPLTHREALAHHEMRHVFQYALWGPFFHSMPLPWLVSLGFSFSDLDSSASDLARHFSIGAVDSLLAVIVWGIGKGAKINPAEANLTGALAADLKTITFPVDADPGQIAACTPDSPVSIGKSGFTTNGAIAELNTNDRTIKLRVALRSDRFVAADVVAVQVSAFEKIRKVISNTLGMNVDQLWSDRVPTSWGRVLSKFLNRDSWTPLLGIYWLSMFRGELDARRIPLEQDAAFHSGDLYSSLALSVPHEIFVGQFAAIYGFIQHRIGSPKGDIAMGLSFIAQPLELLTVELPSGVTADKVSGAIPAATAGQVRFRENWYIPMNEKVENVIGAYFATSAPGDYILHVPGELGPNEEVVFQDAAPLDFLKMKKIKVKPLVVTPRTDAAHPVFETEEVRFQIAGDNPAAEYRIRYKGTPPVPPATISGLRFTAPVLPGPASPPPHVLEITATYPDTHPVFHSPGQLPNIRLTADQRTNLCQEFSVNINLLTAPAVGPVAAGRRVDFDTPIAARSVRVTSPIPAGAAAPARVIIGAGRPAHNTFFAPNAVTAATDVIFELVFGTAPTQKTVNVTVRVTP